MTLILTTYWLLQEVIFEIFLGHTASGVGGGVSQGWFPCLYYNRYYSRHPACRAAARLVGCMINAEENSTTDILAFVFIN